jgi:hypothetical protein
MFAFSSEVEVCDLGNAKGRGIRKYGVEVIFSDMAYLPTFIKIYKLARNLLGGKRQADGQIHGQTERMVTS